MKKFCLIFLAGVTLMTSCTSKGSLHNLAMESLRESLYYPDQMKVIAMSDPDSAFGINYFTMQEIQGMLRTMKVVTDSIMVRTDNMTKFNPDDYYVISLADRQMKATSDIRDMLFKSERKGKWSGWKVKIDYQSIDHNGLKYRSERWTFIDKKGNNVLRTFDLPLP
ncbi:MAG: hypothetical protein LKI18_00090 [Prevotella sp.]|jgi:hypothetical protein|nr:hypothetical protein [Prevotella sp.]